MRNFKKFPCYFQELYLSVVDVESQNRVPNSIALPRAVEGLDICFDLLWEARALFESRQAYLKHRKWQLRLHNTLRTVREQHTALAQEAAQRQHQAQEAVKRAKEAAKLAREKSASASPNARSRREHLSHEQMQRNVEAGASSLAGYLADTATAVGQLAVFVAASGKDDARKGSQASDEQEKILQRLIGACEVEFHALRRWLAVPLGSPQYSHRHKKGQLGLPKGAKTGASDTAAYGSDDSFDGSEDMQDGDHSNAGNGSDSSDSDGPIILSASQQRRREMARKRVLGVLRGRRREQMKQQQEAEQKEAERRAKLLRKRQQQEQLQHQQQRQKQRARQQLLQQQRLGQTRTQLKQLAGPRVGHKDKDETKTDSNGLQSRDTVPSSAIRNKSATGATPFLRNPVAITELPAIAGPSTPAQFVSKEYDVLGGLFFPGAGGRVGLDGREDVVRKVMAKTWVDKERFKELVTSSKEARLSDSNIARIYRVIDVHGTGSVHAFDLLLGVATVLFAARWVFDLL